MTFKVGDKVRVKQMNGRGGPTVFVLKRLLPRCVCFIAEEGVKNAIEQRFDTGLLVAA